MFHLLTAALPFPRCRVTALKTDPHELRTATDGGADVSGFFYRSLLDKFEWQFGCSKKIGLLLVDFNKTPRIG